MNSLTLIEERHRFRVPLAYRAFAERGYLTHPGAEYLWVHEAEWILPSEIAEYVQPLEAGAKLGLVPFAFAGNRDWWCWNVRRSTSLGEPPIVYCPRDSYEGHWHAPNFVGWLYRLSLEYAASMWDAESETKRNITTWGKLVREFGLAEWADDLERISGRAPVEYEVGPRQQRARGLLMGVELDERIRNAFGEAYVNAPFVWRADDK